MYPHYSVQVVPSVWKNLLIGICIMLHQEQTSSACKGADAESLTAKRWEVLTGMRLQLCSPLEQGRRVQVATQVLGILGIMQGTKTQRTKCYVLLYVSTRYRLV